jgi:PAS domain S-box-containing protein
MPELANTAAASAWNGGAMAFRALIDNLEQGVYLLDREGRCLAVNRAFRRWLDRPEGELLGRVFFDSWPDRLAQQEADEHQRVLRGERIEKEEQWPIGRRAPRVRILKVPVADPQGETCGVLCLLRDPPPLRLPSATDTTGTGTQPAGETSGQQQWRHEMLGRLHGGILHDIRNLLMLQVTPLGLLRSALPPGTAAEEPLHALGNAIDMGAALVERLLRVVRDQGSGTALIDVNEACIEVAQLLKSSISPRISLDLRLRPDLPAVRGGAIEIRQVLLNLCLNARDAMPRGGQLVIETDLVRGTPGSLSNNFLCLRVRDTGEGMTPEVQARIFEPFYTTKSSGPNTGQGLAIADDLVRQMGGRIECQSVLGAGTAFTLWLPDPATPASGSVSQPVPSTASPTILVVERDPGVSGMVRTILERRGFQVVQAEEGVQAVELYRQRQEDIAVVLLDQDLSDLSSPATLHELLRLNPALRLLLVSGTGASAPPGHGFLRKPYTADELVGALRAVLTGETRAEIRSTCDVSCDLP